MDFLKIDGEFLKNIVSDATDRALVKAIANVALTVGIRTVAAFVDNDAMEDLLLGLPVDSAQGFVIHKLEPLR